MEENQESEEVAAVLVVDVEVERAGLGQSLETVSPQPQPQPQPAPVSSLSSSSILRQRVEVGWQEGEEVEPGVVPAAPGFPSPSPPAVIEQQGAVTSTRRSPAAKQERPGASPRR